MDFCILIICKSNALNVNLCIDYAENFVLYFEMQYI